MKSVLLSMTVFIAVLLISTCGGPMDESVTDDALGEASMVLEAAGVKEAGYTITGVELSLTHQSEGTTVEESLTIDSGGNQATGTITGLQSGTWDIIAELYEEGALIGSGSATFEVVAGEDTSVSIYITVDGIDIPSEQVAKLLASDGC